MIVEKAKLPLCPDPLTIAIGAGGELPSVRTVFVQSICITMFNMTVKHLFICGVRPKRAEQWLVIRVAEAATLQGS